VGVAQKRFTHAQPTSETHGERDAYGIALIVLAVSTLLLIAADTTTRSFAALFALLLQLVALGLTMHVSGASPRTKALAFGSMALLLVAAVLGALLMPKSGALVVQCGWLGLVVITIWGIVRRLAHYKRVTLPLVLGLLCVYVLLGLTFGLSYGIASELAPPALSGSAHGLSGAIYFSFVTLTTVGYGDLTPARAGVRALAVAEAILGQLYLVGVVSLAVGRLGTGRPERPAADEDD
jgi:hypothetical protein